MDNVRSLPPLRILLAPSAYYPHIGGIEELTRQLALELASREYRVSVLTNRWPEGVRDAEVIDGIPVARLRFPLPAAHLSAAMRFLFDAPVCVGRLIAHLRSVRPDIVHVIGAGPQSAYLGAVAPLVGRRLVFTAQGELGFDADDVFRSSATLRIALRHVLRHADAVTACSSYVLRELAAFGTIKSDAVVVPNGVNPDDFSRAAPAVESDPYVIAVGRLVPQKGFDVLIEALARGRLGSLRLLIAGEGPEREHLARLAHERGIDRRVLLLGPVTRSDLPELLRGARAFVLPSRAEPFGIALLEAMAAGIPSVATRAGGISDFVRDGENALLVPPDDATALSDALDRLCSDEPLRARLSQQGRLTAGSLTWRSIADMYERVYTVTRRPDGQAGVEPAG